MSKLLALIFISSVLFFTECKKYPEGPSISFISKKERSDKKTFTINPKTISFGTVPSASSHQILKLYENEFWIRNIDSNGKIIEYHLIPQ